MARPSVAVMEQDRPLTALIVEIPEAEPVVGALRSVLDPSAGMGAPAHVTVLFPFLPVEDLDDGVLDRIGAVVGAVPAFPYRFSRTAWFDDRVVWLAPDDDGPFRRLTGRVWAEFPDHPPFEGAFADVVPHLTIGQDRPPDTLLAAERAVRARLPVTGTASEVLLLAQQPGGRWQRRARFPLRRPR